MKYKAVIFDLDGTLVNSIADLSDSVNIMLKEYGYPEHDEDEYKYFVGNGSRKLVERALPKEKSADDAFVAQLIGLSAKEAAERAFRRSDPDGKLRLRDFP